MSRLVPSAGTRTVVDLEVQASVTFRVGKWYHVVYCWRFDPTTSKSRLPGMSTADDVHERRARAGVKRGSAKGLAAPCPPALRAPGEDRRGPARRRFRDW